MNERATGVSAADEDRPVVPAVEPALGARRAASGVEVEPAAVALEERPAAVEPDRPADDRAEQVAERARRATTAR